MLYYSQESPILRLVWGINRETFLKDRFEITRLFLYLLGVFMESDHPSNNQLT